MSLKLGCLEENNDFDRSDPLPRKGYTNPPAVAGQQPSYLHAKYWLDGEMRNLPRLTEKQGQTVWPTGIERKFRRFGKGVTPPAWQAGVTGSG
jgi:hypothetical protein